MKRREFLARGAAAVGVAVLPAAALASAPALPAIRLRDQWEVMTYIILPLFNALSWQGGDFERVIDDPASPHYLGRRVHVFYPAIQTEAQARVYFEQHAYAWQAVTFGRKQPIRVRDASGSRRDAEHGDTVLVDRLAMTVCEAERRGEWFCYGLEARL